MLVAKNIFTTVAYVIVAVVVTERAGIHLAAHNAVAKAYAFGLIVDVDAVVFGIVFAVATCTDAVFIGSVTEGSDALDGTIFAVTPIGTCGFYPIVIARTFIVIAVTVCVAVLADVKLTVFVKLKIVSVGVFTVDKALPAP